MIDNNAQAALPGSSSEQPSLQAEAQIWTASVDQGEAPSSRARVDIEVSKSTFKAGMCVPGRDTGQMINASARVLGMISSVAGPLLALQVSVDLPMPWQGIWGLVLVLGILPVIHVLLGNRHDAR